MSISSYRSTVNRLNREIGDLRKREASEIRKEADATIKANAAQISASRASNASLAKSYRDAAARASKDVEVARDRRARHAADIARKSQELIRAQERVSRAEATEQKAAAVAAAQHRKEEQNARKKLIDANLKLQRDYENRIAALETQIALQIEGTEPFQVTPAKGEDEPYDLFISHASKDKADFVDELAAQARAAGLKVWYDQFRLGWGSRVRREIDKGLRSSYFGVVVLSPNFFDRQWPEYELDGLIQKDIAEQGRLLPIWHKLTHGDIVKYAPSLADRMALNTANVSIESMVEELVEMRNNLKSVASNPPEHVD